MLHLRRLGIAYGAAALVALGLAGCGPAAGSSFHDVVQPHPSCPAGPLTPGTTCTLNGDTVHICPPAVLNGVVYCAGSEPPGWVPPGGKTKPMAEVVWSDPKDKAA